MNTITKDNYFTSVEKLGIINLPAPLQTGHNFVIRATDNGKKMESASDVINKTINLQVQKLNEWAASQNKPAEKPKFKKGDSVYMTEWKFIEPLLNVVKVNEWSDKNATYDLRSADGKIVRNNIGEDKLTKHIPRTDFAVEWEYRDSNRRDVYKNTRTNKKYVLVDYALCDMTASGEPNTPVIYWEDVKVVVKESGHNPQKKAKHPVDESIERGYEKAKKEAAKKAKRPRVEKTKKVGSSGLPVEHISPAVGFIKRFIGFNGKQVSYDKLMALLRSLQKAITEKIIRSADKYSEEIKEIQTFLVARANENVETFEITIGGPRLEKFQKIVGSETKMLIVTLLKQYIGLVGKKDVKEKAEALLKRIAKYEEKEEITKKDKYYNFLEVAVKRMKEYVSGKERHVKPTIAELNGLAGIGCDCDSALGMIYDIKKPLRKTKDRKYTDAKGRGAGSHHGGLAGIGEKRAKQIAAFVIEMAAQKGVDMPELKSFCDTQGITNLEAANKEFRNIVNNANHATPVRLAYEDSLRWGEFYKANKGIGTIYKTKKSLRPTKHANHYTDAKGRGAGSHHGGLGNADELGASYKADKEKVFRGTAMSIEDILAVEHTPIGLDGKWKELIGEACKPMNILMYGKGGSGKSGMALTFSQYLSEKGHPVLYVAGESFGTPVFKQLIMDAGIKGNDKFHIVPNLKGQNLGAYDFVVLDSKDSLKLDIEQFRSLKKNYPKLSFIVLSQGKKDGDYRGSEEWRNEVDTLINFPERGKASTADENGKNRWGGCAIVQMYEPKKA